ncbi:MAG: hypothetical protein AB7D29_07670 [Campylobacterales bacterium]
MQNTTLERLLKAKVAQNKDIEELIAEYINSCGDLTYKSVKELFDEILIFANSKYESLDADALYRIFEARINELNILPKNSLLPIIYEKSIASGLAATFSAIDIDAIAALENRMVWAANDMRSRTQDKLKDILGKAYSGAYTKEEFMQTLRDSFDAYAEIAPEKLKTAADFNLRQNRNIGNVIAADKAGIKYLRVVATMDEKTTPVCRAMNGKLIAVSDAMMQVDKIINAKSVADVKAATNLNPDIKALYDAGTLETVRVPPYHFGCRTIVEWVANAIVGDLKLDEFNREYLLESNIIQKINKKHLSETRYKSAQAMVDATMSDIAKEGEHSNRPGVRVVYGKNGCLAIISQEGKVETCFAPSRTVSYYEKYANMTNYDSLQTVFDRIKKWLFWLQ